MDVTNTNPEIIKIFLNFLRKEVGVDEVRSKLQLQVHEGDNQAALEKFWSQSTSIPMDRFNKTIVRPKGTKIGKSNGTCKIRYSDKSTYNKLCAMLKDLLICYGSELANGIDYKVFSD